MQASEGEMAEIWARLECLPETERGDWIGTRQYHLAD